MPDIESSAAQIYIYHLGTANRKFQERELARRKLALELAALKKISTPSLHKHLTKLEQSIEQTISSERKILTRQQKEDKIHSRLTENVKEIEDALDNYLSLAKHQQIKTNLLNQKINVSTKSRQEALTEIEHAINRLEKIYAYELEATQAHRHRELLHRIKQKAFLLKKKSCGKRKLP